MGSLVGAKFWQVAESRMDRAKTSAVLKEIRKYFGCNSKIHLPLAQPKTCKCLHSEGLRECQLDGFTFSSCRTGHTNCLDSVVLTCLSSRSSSFGPADVRTRFGPCPGPAIRNIWTARDASKNEIRMHASALNPSWPTHVVANLGCM